MPFIVGAPRSGTTMLRFMLDAHPELAIPPETGFFTAIDRVVAQNVAQRGDDAGRRAHFFDTLTHTPPEAPGWGDFGLDADGFRAALEAIEPFEVGEGFRTFYRLYAARFGKSRWGDKTPLHCMHVEAIARVMPEAHFIHVIRDGRDVALSLRETWFSPGPEIETQAAFWKLCVSTARAQGARCAHYMEVRFEELVQNATAVLERICEFIDLPLSAAMARYYEGVPERLREHRERVDTQGRVVVSRATRLHQQAQTTQPPQSSRALAWRGSMSADEQRRFAHVAGAMLDELGYPMA